MQNQHYITNKETYYHNAAEYYRIKTIYKFNNKGKNCVAMELWSNNFRQPAHACYKNYGFIVNDAKFFSKEI